MSRTSFVTNTYRSAAHVFVPTVILFHSLLTGPTAVFGHNSIVPVNGWKVERPVALAKGDSSKLMSHSESAHFEIVTTLGRDAADMLCRHLEVWHNQILAVLPDADSIWKEKAKAPNAKVRMRVFAYPEEKGAFYGSKQPKAGNDTGGVVCVSANGKPSYRSVPITALQHEVFHYWSGVYYGKTIPYSLNEGGADFFGLWDIDKTAEENLRGSVKGSEFCWKFAEESTLGGDPNSKYHWLSVREFFENQRPKGCMIYQQGWWLYRFLLSGRETQLCRTIVLSAYRSDSTADQFLKSSSAAARYVKDEFRSASQLIRMHPEKLMDIPFKDAFLDLIERDWKAFVKAELEKSNNRKVGSFTTQAPASGAAGTGEPSVQASSVQFKTNWAVSAKRRYDQTNGLALQQYLRELDAAMQSGLLNDANALNAIRKQIVAGGLPDGHVTMPAARTATTRYLQSLSASKQQYLRDLETALKWAMAGSNLDEANAINSVKAQVADELKGVALFDKGDSGLLLTIGSDKQLWKNTKLRLPTAKTPVAFSGYLALPANVKLLRLRSAAAYGSERLRFTIDGRTIEFESEKIHRFVMLTPPAGAQQLRLEIGKSIAATEWEWGPLQWSVNGSQWKDVPLSNLVSK